MRLVLSDREAIPEWLYPGSFRDIHTEPSDCISVGDVSFQELWAVLDPESARQQALLYQSFVETGIPHDAPACVDRINPELLKALLAVPHHDRWKIARQWATAVHGKVPNDQLFGRFKRLLRDICLLAERCTEEKMLVVLPGD